MMSKEMALLARGLCNYSCLRTLDLGDVELLHEEVAEVAQAGALFGLEVVNL